MLKSGMIDHTFNPKQICKFKANLRQAETLSRKPKGGKKTKTSKREKKKKKINVHVVMGSRNNSYHGS